MLAIPDEAKVTSSGLVQFGVSIGAGGQVDAWARRVVAWPEDPVRFQVQVIHNGASAHLRAVV